MRIKSKLTLLVSLGFFLISVFSFYFISRLFIANRSANFNIFKSELLVENMLSMEEAAEMFFTLIELKFLAGESQKEVLEYIKEIDQLNRAVIVFDYQGHSLLKGHSQFLLEQFLTPAVIREQVQQLHIKSRKNFTIDNFQAFMESPFVLVPRKLNCRIYNACQWVVGYGKVMDSIEKRLLFIKREHEHSASALMTVSFIILLCGIAITIIAVLFYSRRALFRPLESLIRSFDRVSRGDLTHRIKVITSNEMGQLATAFNSMTENFSNSVHEIRAVNIKLDSYSKELGNRVERRTKELSDMVQRLRKEVEDRKRVEEQLRIFEWALIQSIDGVIVLDMDGFVLFANQSWATMHQFTTEECLGKHVSIFHTPMQLENEMGPLAAIVKEKGSGEGEAGHVRKDGQIFPCWMSVTLLKDELSKPIGIVSITRDITESKIVANQLQEARMEAESANLAKSQFLANMSHEIRTPMNAIIGMSELVMDTELSPEQEDYIATLKASAESLLNLLNDILDLSKIEVGKLEVEALEFDIRKCIGDVIRNLLVQAQRKGIELIYDIAWDIPPLLIGDPSRLRQIVTNLIGNSIKFTHQGLVVVRVFLAEENILSQQNENEAKMLSLSFTVSDTGIGIPAEKQQVIFDKFTQTDSSITRKYGGSGLGLTISRQLVQLMGGKIGVRSPGDLYNQQPAQSDPGSTFFFTLPFAVPAGAVKADEPTNIQQLKGKTALVIDDTTVNREIFAKMMERWGMNVATAENGFVGLELLRQAVARHDEFYVVLMDIQMPEMDGFQVIEKIRQEEVMKNTRIIVLTSAGLKGDGKRCRQLGVAAYLKKPVSAAQLRETLLLLPTTIVQSVGHSDVVEPVPPANKLITRFFLPGNREKYNILVAEDNLINQKLIYRILEKRGFLVDIANNGRETYEKWLENTYDLVLMDIQMPEMDGIEATCMIRKREKETGAKVTPVIALTAHAMKGDRERFLEAGMNNYISKPIKQAELLSAIEKVLNLSAKN